LPQIAVNPLPRLDKHGRGNTTGSYNLGPQARFQVDHMEQTKKWLQDSIARLMEHLQSMETKVDKFIGDLGAIQSKVDHAIASINLGRQEQVQVAALL
jgi:flagellin-like hook-associated protein FlgL